MIKNFKVILSYIVSSRSAKVTWNSVSKYRKKERWRGGLVCKIHVKTQIILLPQPVSLIGNTKSVRDSVFWLWGKQGPLSGKMVFNIYYRFELSLQAWEEWSLGSHWEGTLYQQGAAEACQRKPAFFPAIWCSRPWAFLTGELHRKRITRLKIELFSSDWVEKQVNDISNKKPKPKRLKNLSGG